MQCFDRRLDEDAITELLRDVFALLDDVLDLLGLDCLLDVLNCDPNWTDQDLTATLSDQYARENEYKLTIDKLHQDMVELLESSAKIEDQKTLEMQQLQGLIEKANLRAETLETERNKLQEEIDTLNQTLNYNTNELEEKKNLLLSHQTKVSFPFKALSLTILAIRAREDL